MFQRWTSLSILLNISNNNNISNTWAVINKSHKHPRGTSSLGLVLTDLLRDKEMIKSDCCKFLNFQWIPVAVFWRGPTRGGSARYERGYRDAAGQSALACTAMCVCVRELEATNMCSFNGCVYNLTFMCMVLYTHNSRTWIMLCRCD